MSRRMDSGQSAAFRSVITVTYKGNPDCLYESYREDDTHTLYAGPYATLAAAKAAISRERRGCYGSIYGYAGKEVSGYVERSQIVWERVTA